MERESFEDPDVAALMNERFVCIKVDREERPDVDAIYMDAVQAMTGQGGWPLNAFLTPDGVPFCAGTYFPPRRAPGHAVVARRCSRASPTPWDDAARRDRRGGAADHRRGCRARRSWRRRRARSTPASLDAAVAVALRAAFDARERRLGRRAEVPGHAR